MVTNITICADAHADHLPSALTITVWFTGKPLYASHYVLHPQAQNPFAEEYGLPLALLAVTASSQHHIELWDHAQQSDQNCRRI